MHVLVTGGGGFLGRHICQHLISRGDRVRSIARSAYPELDAMGVETVRGDLTRLDDIAKACQGVDAVIHTAAKVGMWGPREDFVQGNIVATQNVIAACRQNNVDTLVFTSSPSVTSHLGDTINGPQDLPYPDDYLAFYPETKAEAERLVLGANDETLKTTSLRPHLIWGPGDPHMIPRLISRARKRKLRIVGEGDNVVDLTYIDNAAIAHVQALDALKNQQEPALAGKPYFISDDQPVNLWSWLNALFERVGVPQVNHKISLNTAMKLGAAAERSFRLLRLSSDPPMTRFVASQLATSHWYDMAPAKRDFNYTPIMTMDDGLTRLVDDIQTRGL